jgi:hypothetical protein
MCIRWGIGNVPLTPKVIVIFIFSNFMMSLDELPISLPLSFAAKDI